MTPSGAASGSDMAFLVAKVAASLASPYLLVILALLAGTACLWIPRAAAAGRWIVSGGVVVLLLISWSPLTDPVLRHYELRYPPVTERSTLPDSAWIVVLGGGTEADARLPPLASLTDASLARVAEGVRLHRMVPGSRLMVSGGTVAGTVPMARTMAAAAVSLGVDPAEMVIEDRPRNTAQEAVRTAQWAQGRPVVLVTSASHMPRAVRLFEAQGLQVIPAPAHYLAARPTYPRAWARHLVPSAGNVLKLERATYELLAGLRR